MHDARRERLNMKIEIGTLPTQKIKARNIPPGRIARDTDRLFLARSPYPSGDELIRVWPTVGEFQSISMETVGDWDVELLPEGTEVKFIF